MLTKKIVPICATVFATALALTTTTSAHGFAILLDATLAYCDEDFAASSAEIPIGRYNFSSMGDSSQCNDGSLLDPFSVNLGGTSYDSVHINNDGLLTFGSAYSGATSDLTDAGFGPAIAGLFTDSAYETPAGGRISWGSTDNPGIGDFLSINYEGKGTYYQLNLFNRDDVAAGDFDVQINYTFDAGPVDLGVLPAQIGFNNGAGQSFLLPGSGIAGAFNGTSTECGTPAASPFSLSCNSLGSTLEGRVVFEFRNGMVVNVPTANVSEPATGLLLLMGLLGLAPLRRRLSANS